MSAVPYIPRSGSAAQRAIEFFQRNPDEELTRRDVAEKFGIDPMSVDSCLSGAVEAGLLTRSKSADSTVVWTRGDKTLTLVPAHAAWPVPAPAPEPDLQPVDTEAYDLLIGAAVPAATGPLRTALWSDGTLVVERRGERIEFSREEARELVAYLDSIALDSLREGAD